MFSVFVGYRVLEEGHCVVECAKGKYRLGGQCHLCDHTCATCMEAGPANCTSCDSGRRQHKKTILCVSMCSEQMADKLQKKSPGPYVVFVLVFAGTVRIRLSS